MKELLHRFEHKAPEIVFEWHDAQTTVRGWLLITPQRGGGKGKRVIVQGWLRPPTLFIPGVATCPICLTTQWG